MRRKGGEKIITSSFVFLERTKICDIANVLAIKALFTST
jgi:hypothetical protein